MDDVAKALDEVWQSSEPRLDVSSRVVKRLGPRSLLQLIALDVSSLLLIVPTSLRVSLVTQSALLTHQEGEISIRVAQAGDPASIEYVEGIRVMISGMSITQPVKRSLTNMLAAAQIARDHSDSLAFLSSDLRAQRLRNYASEFQISVKEFTHIASSFPAIQRALK